MKKLTLATGLLLSLGLTTSAFASDGTVTITGKVIDQSCVVNTGGKDQTVKLPTVQTSTLNEANKTAGKTPFTISLENCNASTDQVSAFFLPSATNVNSDGNLKNLVTNGAENVAVQLVNEDDSAIKVGYNVDNQNVAYKALDNKTSKVLNYKAQYIATGTATAGDVKAQVEYNIIYQ